MKKSAIGKLDQRIELQQRSAAKQANGEEVISWSTVATVWAAVRHVSGRELLARYGIDAEQLVTFTIRARDDLDPTMRVAWGGRHYDIAGLPPDTREAFMTINCTEGLTNG